jgi:hypothetical protein
MIIASKPIAKNALYDIGVFIDSPAPGTEYNINDLIEIGGILYSSSKIDYIRVLYDGYWYLADMFSGTWSLSLLAASGANTIEVEVLYLDSRIITDSIIITVIDSYEKGITVGVDQGAYYAGTLITASGFLTSSAHCTSIELVYAGVTYYPVVAENWTYGVTAQLYNYTIDVTGNYDDGSHTHASVGFSVISFPGYYE